MPGTLDGDVILKLDLRYAAHGQDLCQFMAVMAGVFVQITDQFFDMSLPTQAGDEDPRVFQVRTDVYGGHGYQAETRIGNILLQLHRQCPLHQIGYPAVAAKWSSPHKLYRTSDFHTLEDFDLIPDLDIVITHADPAFRTGLDLADVILEAAQGIQHPLVDDDIVP